MKKHCVQMMVLVLLCSLLTACAAKEESTVAEVPKTTEVAVAETEVPLETEELPPKTAEEEVIVTEKVALGAVEEGSENLSAEFVYNANKLRVSDEDDNYKYMISLELIGDTGSVLDVTCSYATAQELYEETLSGYEGTGWQVSQMRESTLLGLTAYYYEMTHEEAASANFQYFIIDLGNGLCLNNENASGYSGNESLENMMSYAFLEINPGDGTLYRPGDAFTVEDNGEMLSVTFNSGASYTLDYDESVMEFILEGNRMSPYFIDSELVETCVLQMYITNKYASIAEYENGQAEAHHWEVGLPVEEVTINGIDIQYIVDESREMALFFIPMTEGYAIRGIYEYWPYKDGISSGPPAEVALAKMFGGDVEAAIEKEKAKRRVDYGYQTPDSLGDDMEKLYFELEGVRYSFPVPVSVMTENGWNMVDETNSLEVIPQMAPGETRRITLENEKGCVIDDVVLDNPTDEIIPVQEGLVTEMVIKKSANADLKFAEGICFDTTKEDVIISTGDMVADNGDVLSYFWHREDGSWVAADVGKEDGKIKQFFFVGVSECYNK